MPNKKYTEFPTGIFSNTKWILQADEITGLLQKMVIPSMQPQPYAETDILINMLQHLYRINNASSYELNVRETMASVNFNIYPKFLFIEAYNLATYEKATISINTNAGSENIELKCHTALGQLRTRIYMDKVNIQFYINNFTIDFGTPLAASKVTYRVNGINPNTNGNTTLANIEYADNATAIAAGRPIGYMYRTGDVVKVVHS